MSEQRKPSQRTIKKIREELRPVFQPYHDHQGWPDDVHTADAATRVILEILNEELPGVQL